MAFGGMWLASFFQGLSTGFWLPALTNILNAKGMGEWVGWAFAVPPVCALFSPLIGGALADERVSAQKLFAWCSLTGAVMLFLAFGALDAGFGPVWFLFFLAGYSIVSGPTWGLLATISMTHLGEGGRRYPLVRVGATIGWIVAGFLTSYALRGFHSVGDSFSLVWSCISFTLGITFDCNSLPKFVIVIFISRRSLVDLNLFTRPFLSNLSRIPTNEGEGKSVRFDI